jgi:hypothetical protein
MVRWPDFGYADSDPRPENAPIDLRPDPPSQAAQDHSSTTDKD